MENNYSIQDLLADSTLVEKVLLENQELKNQLQKLQEKALNDRFFLEEILRRDETQWYWANEYSRTLATDWLLEMIEKIPLTEEERAAHLARQGWDEDFLEAAYCESEAELKEFLGSKEKYADFKAYQNQE